MDLTKVKENAIDGLALALGVSTSVIVMALAKGKVPFWLEPFVSIVPGLGLAIVADDKRIKTFGKGWITVGILDGANKVTSKIPALAEVNKVIPKINGLGRLGAAPVGATQGESMFLSGLGASSGGTLFLS